MARPNFFILLGLNPDQAWDEGKFQAALTAKSEEWNRLSLHPTKGAEADINRGMIPEIKRVMAAPAERDKECQEAKKLGSANKTEVISRFEAELAVAEKSGSVVRAQIDKWEKELVGVMSRSEIERRIKVPIHEIKPPPPTKPQLEPSKAQTIHSKLATLGQTSLYTLLKTLVNAMLHEGSRRGDLYNAADELRKIGLKNANKTPEGNLRDELAGLALEIFKTDDMRTRYDETLRQEKMESIISKYVEACKFTKEITAQQADAFLNEARQAKYSVDEAKQRLIKLAGDKKWPLTFPGTIVEKWLCGQCGQLNDPNDKFCTNCRDHQTRPCPDCENSCASADVACGKCGFPIGGRFGVTVMLNDAEKLVRDGKFTDAQTKVADAERNWSPRNPDDLRRRAQQIRASIDQTLNAQHQAEAKVTAEKRAANEKLRHLIDERKLKAARELLQDLAPGVIVDAAVYRAQIEGGYTRAQSFFEQAVKPGLTTNERVKLLLQVRGICADYPGVEWELSKLPPEPPRNLEMSLAEKHVSLRWTPSPTEGAREYRIVRKAGSRPIAATDGTTLATVTSLYYDDRTPDFGKAVFYAVYAVREGVPSATAAIADRSLLLPRDVIFPTVESVNTGINLRWDLPPGVERITIVRKMGSPPQAMTDGMVLQTYDPKASRVEDRGLQNGMRYFYRITCEFRDELGKVHTSQGEVIDATPQQPPKPVNDLEITTLPISGGGFQVMLRWSAPEKGKVIILKSERKPDLRVGTSLAKMLIVRYGQELSTLDGSLMLTDHCPRAGIYYYTPLTSIAETGSVFAGDPRRCVCVEEVQELIANPLGPTIRLQWVWPTGCQEVTVAYMRQAYPQLESANPNVTTTTVTRERFYASGGHYDIAVSGAEDYFIVVATHLLVDGKPIPGNGVRTRVRLGSQIVLEYEFAPRGHNCDLVLKPRSHGYIPAFMIRGKRGSLPLNRQDGELIGSFGGVRIDNGPVLIPLVVDSVAPNTLGKLFFLDDDDFDVVRVLPPPERKAKLH